MLVLHRRGFPYSDERRIVNVSARKGNGVSGLHPVAVRVILFDAVNTLIRAEPPVEDIYHRLGGRYGSHLCVEEIKRRFRAAFCRQKEQDRQRQWQTDEQREYRRWQSIVGEVFAELADTEDLFDALWNHFARADAWACFPEVAESLVRLAARGYLLGIASNFDRRLRAVTEGISALEPCRRWLFISSELGWLKPARQFFETITERLGVAAREILYVGDDYQADCLAALHAGWQAVWICRECLSGRPSLAKNDDAVPANPPCSAVETGSQKRPTMCPTIKALNELIQLV